MLLEFYRHMYDLLKINYFYKTVKTMRSIKIIHFVSGFKDGGVEQMLLNYTQKLNENYQIKNIIVYQHDPSIKKIQIGEKFGDIFYRIPDKEHHPFLNLLETYKILKKEKPDIVHAHMNLVNFFPLFVAKRLKVPVRISHSHIAHNNINILLEPLFKKLNIRFANSLLACGKKAGEYMYGDKKFKIIYNAIDEKKYSYNEESRKKIRKKNKINESTVLLGTVGKANSQKNQKFLVDIFDDYHKINPDSKLMIIGDGELSLKLDEYIQKKESVKDVIRIKSIASTSEYYSSFDVFLLPSLYEGLPVSAIEAQASGVLTLLSDSIDKTTKYTDKTDFISISSGTSEWVDSIQKDDNSNRNIDLNNQYNINLAYESLYTYYINRLTEFSND